MKTRVLQALPCLLLSVLPACNRPTPAQPAAAGSADTKPTPTTAPKGRIVVAVQTTIPLHEEGHPLRGCAILAVDPDTGATERLVESAKDPSVAADGKTMVYVTDEGIVVRPPDGSSQLIASADPNGASTLISADGKEIVYNVARPPSKETPLSFDSWRCTAAGGAPTKLAVPDTDAVADWSPDGQWFLTGRKGRRGGATQLYVMHPDGTEQRRLSDGTGVISIARFSPDGKRIVYMHQDGVKNSLWVMDSDGQHPSKIVDYSDAWHPWACWSPDGNRLAVVDWDPRSQGAAAHYHLDVMDADGGNRRTLPVTDALWMSAADWR